MSILGFIVLVIVAAIVGSLGQALAGYSHGGCLVSILVGFIGAWIGLWMENGPRTVRLDASPSKVAEVMRKRGVDSVLVTMSDGKLWGVLRRGD